MDAALREELRRLASLLKEAAGAVERIAELLEKPAEEPPPAAPPPEPEPEVVEAPPPEPQIPADPIEALAWEIDQAEPYLKDLERRQRRAQICVWAGRARALQENVDPARARPLLTVFGRLTRLTREGDCGWIDALTREWSMDWDVYVAYHKAIASGHRPLLTPEQEVLFQKAALRGLLLPTRRVGAYEAHSVILEAREALPEGDADLAAAVAKFGAPVERREEGRRPPPRRPRAEEPEEERVDLPAAVRAFTAGKRVLMVGGQGVREEHRRAIERGLEVRDLEWVTSERGQAAPFVQLEERIRPGRYDLVLFLTAYTSHKSSGVLRACKQAGIPLVYLTRGYSPSQVAHAIQQQMVERRAPEPAGREAT